MQVAVKNPRINCYKCMRPSNTCVCEHISPLSTHTRFVILMHPKEYKKQKNGTGHMTKLQLDNSEIIVGVDFTDNKRVNDILSNENNQSFLLYPGKNNFNLSISDKSEICSFMGKSPHLFILDGTWPCARKMLKLSSNLQQLQRVSFDNTIESKFVFKQQPESLCLSTIESVYTFINILIDANIEQCDTQGFLLPFEKMVEFQLGCILDSAAQEDQTLKKIMFKPKTRYKQTHERNIIFEQER